MESKEVLNERRRILELLQAHEVDIGAVYIRLTNLIRAGTDLREEAKLPIGQRAFGFHWDDAKPVRKKKRAARSARPKAKRPK